jgi:hypothetical protein
MTLTARCARLDKATSVDYEAKVQAIDNAAVETAAPSDACSRVGPGPHAGHAGTERQFLMLGATAARGSPKTFASP